MAEARAAVNSLRVGALSLDQVTTAAKLRGIQVHQVDGGLLVVIPSGKFLFRQAKDRLRYLLQHFRTLCWPAPVWGVVGTIVSVMAGVLNAESGSQVRHNWLANFLWTVDERFVAFFDLEKLLPRSIRILYLSSSAAMCILLGLSSVNRLAIRLLLQYRGWMYERKPSMTTMVWGGVMRTFFLGQGKNALTYSFQSAMPRLSVPPLKETISRYLRSIEPLMSPEKLAEVENDAQQFLKGEGKTLQRFLVAKSWFSGNFVSDWWEKYIYLRGRSPILINSNYYGLGYARHIPSAVQTARAGVLVHFFAHFKDLLDAERLPPMTIRGSVPVCMRQFERLFGTTRVPGRDSDSLRHISGTETTHIAVLYKGTLWRVETTSDSGALLEPFQLQDQFDAIVDSVERSEVSGMRVPVETDAEANLPALTAWNRTRWAEVREDHFSHGLNRLSLEEIESAMFFLHLDHRRPETWTETGNLSLHGGGMCRWCDKSFNLLVFANGQATVHAEHSWADAPVIAYSWEWTLAHEHTRKVYDSAGNCLRSADAVQAPVTASLIPKLAEQMLSGQAQTARQPVLLEWQLNSLAKEAILEAMAHARANCADLDLVVDCFCTDRGGCVLTPLPSLWDPRPPPRGRLRLSPPPPSPSVRVSVRVRASVRDGVSEEE